MRLFTRKVATIGAGMALVSGALFGVATASADEPPANGAKDLLDKLDKKGPQVCQISIGHHVAFGGCGGDYGLYVLVAKDDHGNYESTPVSYVGAAVTAVKTRGHVVSATIFKLTPDFERGKVMAEYQE